MKRKITQVALLITAITSPLPAQRDRGPLAVTSGIDTSIAVVRDLVATVQGYLGSEGPGWKPTPYWSAAEQSDAQQYDPASAILGYQLPGTVVQISPAIPADSVYVIKVLFALVDSTRVRWQPLALQRFYAVRQESRWVLTSALGRHTADWKETNVGNIRYRFSPQHHFREGRARRAADFVDSLTAALALPAPDTIEYYLTPSADEMARMLGFDWLKLPSGPHSGRGGWAGAGRLFSGDERRGEEYRHELAHLITGPLRSPTGRHWFIEEGFATWVGGTAGVLLSDGISPLAEFTRTHPRFAWRDLIQFSTPDEIRHLSGALLFEAVHRDVGWPGVRTLLEAGRGEDALFAALPLAWQLTPETFEQWWRSEIQRAASRDSSLP
ncbi:MAG: hypothetical protein ACR2HZ_09865 [Gemmatimonadaceae bacterium]